MIECLIIIAWAKRQRVFPISESHYYTPAAAAASVKDEGGVYYNDGQNVTAVVCHLSVPPTQRGGGMRSGAFWPCFCFCFCPPPGTCAVDKHFSYFYFFLNAPYISMDMA